MFGKDDVDDRRSSSQIEECMNRAPRHDVEASESAPPTSSRDRRAVPLGIVEWLLLAVVLGVLAIAGLLIANREHDGSRGSSRNLPREVAAEDRTGRAHQEEGRIPSQTGGELVTVHRQISGRQ